MDFNQRKLTKSEWDSIEISVNQDEKHVLTMISEGFLNVNIKTNHHMSLSTYLKIAQNPEMNAYLFYHYFGQRIQELISKTPTLTLPSILSRPLSAIQLKKADKIRLESSSTITLKDNTNSKVHVCDGFGIYEFVLMNLIEKVVKPQTFVHAYYTLYCLMKNTINGLNTHMSEFANHVLDSFQSQIRLEMLIENAVELIEKNPLLLKYEDMKLYDHQKRLFHAIKRNCPKLVLYIAPTGTGKTKSPLGLLHGNRRVIYVCAARHVGLALAQSAISINKKIAFGFGCQCSEDIRLHYSAAKSCIRNAKNGTIIKVDNTQGENVEMIICDVQSYLYAMYYMLAFNDAHNIVFYWDEPTIFMDCETHPLHEVIHKNWNDNLIPNIILSTATLPKPDEMIDVIADFKSRHENAEVIEIISHDCKKSIQMIDPDGYVIMPHTLDKAKQYSQMLEIVRHCETNPSLLRYFDLNECVRFIMEMEKGHTITQLVNQSATISECFFGIDDVSMTRIKEHYLRVLGAFVSDAAWTIIYNQLSSCKTLLLKPNDNVDKSGAKLSKSKSMDECLYKPCQQSCSGGNHLQQSCSGGHPLGGMTLPQSGSGGHPLQSRSYSQFETSPQQQPHCDGVAGMYITTKDAYTLTDGPSLFLAADSMKIAKFCAQQANIPAGVMTMINEKIQANNLLTEKIIELEKEMLQEIENEMNSELNSAAKKKDSGGNGKSAEDMLAKSKKKSIVEKQEKINMYRSMIKSVSLNDVFVPNSLHHFEKWAASYANKSTIFKANISDSDVISVMKLNDVDDVWKMLILLGIGVFIQHTNAEYAEIIKRLANEKKLFLTIASSDYIYGSNYQMCHGYISKDMNLTQEKLIQSMGRIGRNNIQQQYSIRFRDNAQAELLFTTLRPDQKPEVVNMNKLFSSAQL